MKNRIKLFKTIAGITLASWLLQSLMFIVLFASSFEHVVVQTFVSLGGSQAGTSAFLSGTMKVLAWPVHSLFPSVWAEASFVEAILLLGLNSLIWGGVLGTLWFFLRRMRTGREAERPV
ncbi:MAG TPA: hypothetical protein VG938_07070 [Verrucomicrobiae bacterium]|jgi:hypothetical protein|nr:hypothetical protein [Verrucomicrobiae bacterium]